VVASDAAYGEFVHGMSPFLGNHDVERFSTYVNGCDTWALFGGCHDLLAEPGGPSVAQEMFIDRLALAWAFVVLQPGTPLLYYGDEIGLAGAGDPDNRRMMPWSRTPAQDALLERVREVSKARRMIEALQVGDRRELWVDQNLYVQARWASGLDTAIVAFAMGASAPTAHVAIPTALNLEGRTLVDHLGSGTTATVSGGFADLTIPPWQPVILVPAP